MLWICCGIEKISSKNFITEFVIKNSFSVVCFFILKHSSGSSENIKKIIRFFKILSINALQLPSKLKNFSKLSNKKQFECFSELYL